MKKILFAILIALVSLNVQAQSLDIDGKKVEVRNDNDRVLAIKYFEGVESGIIFDDEWVCLIYKTDRVEVRNLYLGSYAGKYFAGVKSVSSAGKYIRLKYNNGKTERRDCRLKIIDVRY